MILLCVDVGHKIARVQQVSPTPRQHSAAALLTTPQHHQHGGVHVNTSRRCRALLRAAGAERDVQVANDQQQQQQAFPTYTNEVLPSQAGHVQQHQQHQHSQQQQLQQQVRQCTHWRQLLPLSVNIQSLQQLVLLLDAAVQLQPCHPAASNAAAAAALGPLADQQQFEQQQHTRFLAHLVDSAAQLLRQQLQTPLKPHRAHAGGGGTTASSTTATTTTTTTAAAVAAAALDQGYVPELLQTLVRCTQTAQQQQQQQVAQHLQQLPLAAAIERQARLWQPDVVVQVVGCLALLHPHVRIPQALQQQLFAAAALGLDSRTSASLSKKGVSSPAAAAGAAASPQSSLSSSSSSRTMHASSKRRGVKHSAAAAAVGGDGFGGGGVGGVAASEQQKQKQQQVQVSDVAKTLWAAGRLSWRLPQDLLQQAARAVLMQLQLLRPSDLVLAVVGLAQLGVTVRQLQRCWTAASTAEQQQQQQDNGRQQQQQQVQQPPVPQRLPPKPPQVSAVLCAALLEHCRSLTPQECVAVLGAAAGLQLLPESGLMRALLQAVVRSEALLQLSDEDLASVLWALARMHQNRAAVVRKAQRQQQQQEQEQQEQQQQVDQAAVQQAEAQALQEVLSPDNNTSQLSAQRQQQQQQQQQQQKRRHRAAAHAAVLQQPALVPPDMLLPLLQAYYTTLPTCSSRCMARTLWSVSVLAVVPPRAWMAGVLQRLEPQLQGLDASSSMLVALALARLRYLPEGQWLKQFWASSVALFCVGQQQQQQQQHEQAHEQHDQQQQQQQRLTSSSTVSRGTSSRADSSSSSSTSGHSSSRGQLTQAELTVLAAAAYDLSLLSPPQSKGPWSGQKPPGVWLNALAAASQGYLSPDLDLGTLLMWGEAMMRFSSMAGERWAGPGAAWWQGFVAATEPYLQAAEPKELLRLAKMLSTQQQHRPVSSSWTDAFLAASEKVCLQRSSQVVPAGGASGGGPSLTTATAVAGRSAAGRMQDQGTIGRVQQPESCGKHNSSSSRPLSAQNLANLGKAVAEMGVLPGRSWLDAWDLAVELASCSMSPGVAAALKRTRGMFKELSARPCTCC